MMRSLGAVAWIMLGFLPVAFFAAVVVLGALAALGVKL